MPSPLLIALAAFVFVNGWTFLSFQDDKRRAIAGERRIPESTLLSLAVIGGSPGALLGRQVFRHKTRKQPFSTLLFLIVVLQVGAIAGILLF